MERRPNTASQQTKQALAAALKELMAQKPIENITIHDLTEHCGIRRQTFYYHFEDVYDLPVSYTHLSRTCAKVRS